MTFDNRPPLNLKEDQVVGAATRDGGVYDGIGYLNYEVYQGRHVHLVTRYASGCADEPGSQSHLGMWESIAELGEWLRKQPLQEGRYPWWCGELLEALEIPAEEG